jgi:hypothetical protein
VDDGLITLPARTALVAAGTSPNITYEKECPDTFTLDAKKKFFKPHSVSANGDGGFHLAPDPDGFFTSYERGGRFVSYYGDNHPRYAGNVVKAMASAKHGFPHVLRLFARELAALDPDRQGDRDAAWTRLVARLDEELVAIVEEVVRLTPTIVEVIVKAPAAARHFRPGQFYRLQNYESVARRVGTTPMLMEGHRAHRRVGRPRARAAVAHRARAGRVRAGSVRICRKANRSSSWVRPGADRDPRRAQRAAARRRPRQRRAVLDRQGDARAREPGHLLRRLQEGRGPVQARRHRVGDRSGHLEHRHRRDDCARGARRTRISAATSCRRCSRIRTASSATGSCRSTRSIASSRSDRTA